MAVIWNGAHSHTSEAELAELQDQLDRLEVVDPNASGGLLKAAVQRRIDRPRQETAEFEVVRDESSAREPAVRLAESA